MSEDAHSEAERLFRDEARRRMARVRSILGGGFPDPRSGERAELWRHIHSIQGTATSLGHERIGELSAGIATRLGVERSPGTRELPADEQEVVREEIEALGREISSLASPGQP